MIPEAKLLLFVRMYRIRPLRAAFRHKLEIGLWTIVRKCKPNLAINLLVAQIQISTSLQVSRTMLRALLTISEALLCENETFRLLFPNPSEPSPKPHDLINSHLTVLQVCFR